VKLLGICPVGVVGSQVWGGRGSEGDGDVPTC
jgi:hypothetical protein